MKWHARLLEALPKIQAEYPEHKWLLLTLTVKNCETEQLRNNCQLLSQSFSRLTRVKEWPGIGWLRALEITKDEDGGCHPHLHVLIMVNKWYFSGGGNYLSQAKWTELWKRSARLNYQPIVDIRKIKEKAGKDITAAIVEVVKYSVKPKDVIEDGDYLISITEQLHKIRAISLGGVLKDFINSKDIEPEEEENEENEGGYYFRYNRSSRRYNAGKKNNK